MKVQISLPPEAWDQIKELAQVDRRSPRQQAEWLLIDALRSPPSRDTQRELASVGVGHE